MVILLMAIGGAILLMAIGGYFFYGSWWLF
jgi:hypothetical protein